MMLFYRNNISPLPVLYINSYGSAYMGGGVGSERGKNVLITELTWAPGSLLSVRPLCCSPSAPTLV